jgi:hypothetical protein
MPKKQAIKSAQNSGDKMRKRRRKVFMAFPLVARDANYTPCTLQERFFIGRSWLRLCRDRAWVVGA